MRRGSRTWCPLRYGRMLQSPFTFYRGVRRRHGRRSGPHAGQRHPRPGLRRLPSDEFRRLRHAGAPARSSTSTTSTRPCRRPGSGMSSGSSPRSCWPPARSGCPMRTGRDAAVACARSYREHMRDFARHGRARRLVCAARRQRLSGDAAAGPQGSASKRIAKATARGSSELEYPKLVEQIGAQPRIRDTPPTDLPSRRCACAGDFWT